LQEVKGSRTSPTQGSAWQLGIVLDESDESELWLSVAHEREMGELQQREWLVREAGELRAIFSKGYETARRRERGTG
jgi:hypothetical protein